ncbi:nucleoid occlusion protein [Garciella nitratireducens]|uniref:ParB family protein n=1 Tax=Garciella nitratireducens DSM 15102 TaxID=1121911 RepID=A0A1T4PDE7_9FIRM|nr:nucleoid occlusion protein [Garciella nitratireducens]SJZ89519.1 ParB family protein [Garciella nitratireducens DSM 15102]
MKENANIAREIEYIPVNNIRPNPYQPRKYFNQSAIEELATSIKNYGILQPLSVRKIGESSYELIAGERRLRAAKLLELETVPVIVVEIVDQDSALIALIENLQREDLNYIEEAQSYYHLINDHGLTQEQVAQKVGKTQSTIANKLRLLRLSESVQKVVIDQSLSERHARALLRLPDEELQMDVLNKIIKNKLNVKKTEELIEKTRQKLIEQDHKLKDSKSNRKKSRARVKSYINFRIYVNTIRNAFEEIKKTGVQATFEQKDHEDFLEIKIKLPKK